MCSALPFWPHASSIRCALSCLLIGCLLPAMEAGAASDCGNGNAKTLTVEVDPTHVLRAAVPATVFGFHLPWFDFQEGHFRNGTVRAETIAWLKPFVGAAYRFPGGNSYKWMHAVGPVASRQQIYADYEGMADPKFGPAEFFNLLHQVDGKAVILLNVVGEKDKLADHARMSDENLRYLDWLAANGPGCVAGPNCAIIYFELGNEVDWEKELKWSGDFYLNRVQPLIDSARKRYPGIRFAVVGGTAPWDKQYANDGRKFDSSLAPRLARNVDAVTFHPYYDGQDIRVMESYIDALARTYRRYNSRIKVLITEHGRWPAMPKTGDWRINWYQASGSGGGVSAADFVLMAINRNDIAGAMWHALGVRGPWQLFHWNQHDDSVYPSAVYWSLRALREGFLTDTIAVKPALIPGNSYAGGYDLRLVAMKGKSGQISLMGVNRSADARPIRLEVNGQPLRTTGMRMAVAQADVNGGDNTDENPGRFGMRTLSGTYYASATVPVCIPARSAFSIVLANLAAVSPKEH
jgi:alpha-L-arabinofuranosidase